MPEAISCPHCQRKLRVPDDLLGKKVKCPTCGQAFVAQADQAAEEAYEEVAEEPAPKKSSSARPRPPSPEKRPSSRRPHADEEDEYEEERGPRRPRRRGGNYQPHRGVLILVLVIIGFVTGFGIIFGPIAWIMGNNDMKEIRAGRMDPEGESLTNIGRILGMVMTILSVLALVLVCGFIAFIAIAAGTAK